MNNAWRSIEISRGTEPYAIMKSSCIGFFMRSWIWGLISGEVLQNFGRILVIQFKSVSKSAIWYRGRRWKILQNLGLSMQTRTCDLRNFLIQWGTLRAWTESVPRSIRSRGLLIRNRGELSTENEPRSTFSVDNIFDSFLACNMCAREQIITAGHRGDVNSAHMIFRSRGSGNSIEWRSFSSCPGTSHLDL